MGDPAPPGPVEPEEEAEEDSNRIFTELLLSADSENSLYNMYKNQELISVRAAYSKVKQSMPSLRDWDGTGKPPPPSQKKKKRKNEVGEGKGFENLADAKEELKRMFGKAEKQLMRSAEGWNPLNRHKAKNGNLGFFGRRRKSEAAELLKKRKELLMIKKETIAGAEATSPAVVGDISEFSVGDLKKGFSVTAGAGFGGGYKKGTITSKQLSDDGDLGTSAAQSDQNEQEMDFLGLGQNQGNKKFLKSTELEMEPTGQDECPFDARYHNQEGWGTEFDDFDLHDDLGSFEFSGGQSQQLKAIRQEVQHEEARERAEARLRAQKRKERQLRKRQEMNRLSFNLSLIRHLKNQKTLKMEGPKVLGVPGEPGISVFKKKPLYSQSLKNSARSSQNPKSGGLGGLGGGNRSTASMKYVSEKVVRLRKQQRYHGMVRMLFSAPEGQRTKRRRKRKESWGREVLGGSATPQMPSNPSKISKEGQKLGNGLEVEKQNKTDFPVNYRAGRMERATVGAPLLLSKTERQSMMNFTTRMMEEFDDIRRGVNLDFKLKRPVNNAVFTLMPKKSKNGENGKIGQSEISGTDNGIVKGFAATFGSFGVPQTVGTLPKFEERRGSGFGSFKEISVNEEPEGDKDPQMRRNRLQKIARLSHNQHFHRLQQWNMMKANQAKKGKKESFRAKSKQKKHKNAKKWMSRTLDGDRRAGKWGSASYRPVNRFKEIEVIQEMSQATMRSKEGNKVGKKLPGSVEMSAEYLSQNSVSLSKRAEMMEKFSQKLDGKATVFAENQIEQVRKPENEFSAKNQISIKFGSRPDLRDLGKSGSSKVHKSFPRGRKEASMTLKTARNAQKPVHQLFKKKAKNQPEDGMLYLESKPIKLKGTRIIDMASSGHSSRIKSQKMPNFVYLQKSKKTGRNNERKHRSAYRLNAMRYDSKSISRISIKKHQRMMSKTDGFKQFGAPDNNQRDRRVFMETPRGENPARFGLNSQRKDIPENGVLGFEETPRHLSGGVEPQKRVLNESGQALNVMSLWDLQSDFSRTRMTNGKVLRTGESEVDERAILGLYKDT